MREYSSTVQVTPFFTFGGFLQPVDKDLINQVKAGQAVPVKFSLGGDYGLEIFAAGSPKVELISCASSTSVDQVEETVAATKSGLAFDAGIYTYVWKTDKSLAGKCATLKLQFTDGTVASAQFKLTK